MILKITFIFIILSSIILEGAFGVTCYYYPNYPTSLTSYTRICSFYCCPGYPTSSTAACCTTTTKATTTTTTKSNGGGIDSGTSILIGAIIGGILGAFCLIGIITGVTCSIYNKNRRKLINPGWGVPPYARKTLVTHATPGPVVSTTATTIPYPGTTNNNYNQTLPLNPNPFNQFPSNAPPLPNSNFNNNNNSKIEEPPKYDSLIDQPATININSHDNENIYPSLPAPVSLATPNK